jgi:hypothetical protein
MRFWKKSQMTSNYTGKRIVKYSVRPGLRSTSVIARNGTSPAFANCTANKPAVSDSGSTILDETASEVMRDE